jgi:hypothetical protein
MLRQTPFRWSVYRTLLVAGSAILLIYMRLNPPQVWLRKYWSTISEFPTMQVHPRFLLRKGAPGVSYALLSHICRYDSVGATTNPVDRMYSHHHCCKDRTGKQLPVYSDIRRVGLEHFWFVVIYEVNAPLREIMSVESSLQQLLLPTSNVRVSGKSLPATKIIKGFRPVMRLRQIPANKWNQPRQLRTFTDLHSSLRSIRLGEIFAAMIREKRHSSRLDVSVGTADMHSGIKSVFAFRQSLVSIVTGSSRTGPIFLQHAFTCAEWKVDHVLEVHVLVTCPTDALVHSFLWQCIRRPFLFFDLKVIPPQLLLALYRQVDLHLPYKPASFLKNRFDSSCRFRFGFSLSMTPTLKLPRSPCVDKRAAVCCIKWIIQQLPIHPDLIAWFSSRVRVVLTAPLSLGAVLLNHRKFASSLSIKHPSPCCCSSFPLARGSHGCVEARCSDLASLLFCGPLIAENLNTSLHCGPETAHRRLQDGFNLFHSGFIEQLLSRDKFSQKQFLPWLLPHYSGMLQQVWVPPVESVSLFSVHEAVRIRRLLDGLVILPLDRNINAGFIMCPSVFWSRFETLYWKAPNYEHLSASPSQVLRDMQTSYVQHRFDHHVPLNSGGSLGSAYLLPKQKNPSKSRPIVNTLRMPGRKMSSVVSAVLILLISRATSFMHFNLGATKDLKRRLAEFSEYFTNFTGVRLFSFDVNNMYSVLRRGDIENALFQFLQLVRARLRTLSFHIHKFRKRKLHFWGRIQALENSILYLFVYYLCSPMWEIENMVFMAGDVVLQQSTGIAMGSCCSPAIAQILCIYCEVQWLQSLGADAKFIRGVRFMDDSLVAVVIGHEHVICSYVSDCYPEDCVLEGKLEGATVVPLLETAVHVYGGTNLVCVHNNKNLLSMIDGRYQSLVRYTNCFSFVSNHAAFVVWNGVVSRMVANTTPGFYFNLWWPMWAFMLELRKGGYGWVTISCFLSGLKAWKFDCPAVWCYQLQLFFRVFWISVQIFVRCCG